MSEQQKQLLADPTKLISLARAADLTPYSAEYLSLLSRKGRIPAIKLHRDWLTTEEAVFEYLKAQQDKRQKFLQRFGDSDASIEPQDQALGGNQ